MVKIWCDLGQLSTLTANMSGIDRDIEKQKMMLSTVIPVIEKKENLVNFDPLTPEMLEANVYLP